MGPCHSTPTKSYGTCFIGEEEGEWGSEDQGQGMGWDVEGYQKWVGRL